MRILISKSGSDSRYGAQAGFTLTEILVASTIFIMLVGGVIVVNLFGLRIFQMSQTKLEISQWSRETIVRLTDEIHVCNNAQVGVVSNGIFMAFLDGDTQQGNGLLLNTSTNTNNFIIYFVNTADQTFRRTTQDPGSTVILASAVTNTLPFSAEDFSGNVLTNNSNSQVIHVALEFYQPAFFMQNSSYYKLETSIKQRIVQ
jgi:hypothetical protein